MAELSSQITQCTKCPLHRSRKNVVVGEGSGRLGVMIVGEAPGSREDLEGRPFVGDAGKLLTEALASLGIYRSDVYITNVVKCRPPNNRPPTSGEIAACLPHLLTQISLLKPRRIIALGLTSGKTLLKLVGVSAGRLREVRGKCFSGRLAGVVAEVCISYHPAAVLRNPHLAGEFLRDLENFFKGLI